MRKKTRRMKRTGMSMFRRRNTKNMEKSRDMMMKLMRRKTRRRRTRTRTSCGMITGILMRRKTRRRRTRTSCGMITGMQAKGHDCIVQTSGKPPPPSIEE